MNVQKESVENIIKFINALARVNSQMVKLGRELRKNTHIREVQQHHHFSERRNYSSIEGYVATKTNTDEAIDWCLEIIVVDDSFLQIESAVYLNDAQGQDVLIEFPNKTVNSFDDLLEELNLTVAQLIKTVDRISFNPVQLKS